MIRDRALENSVVVVAHPDDEVLWFSSLLDHVDKVIIVFLHYSAHPLLGSARANAIAELPFEVSCLSVPEAGSFGLADWTRPKTTPYGLRLDHAVCRREVIKVYEQNARTIRSLLKSELSSATNVFTHNPWGEYGHEDHVQIYRIVESLRLELAFDLRVSMYASSRSNVLARRYALLKAGSNLKRPISRELAHNVAAIYKRNDCWTWADDWEWDCAEVFLGPLIQRGNQSGESVMTSPLIRHIPSSVDNRRA